jgi:hypothetical protein
MWAKEIIGNEDFVYRQCHFSEVIKKSGLRFPNEAHFKPDEDGLSVNWNRKIDLPQNYILIGISRKVNGQFKNHTDFRIFQYPVRMLKSIEGIEAVEHDPQFHGNPSPVGKPNNPAHSLVKYEDEEHIRMNLSDYSRDNNNEALCVFNVNSLNVVIEDLRSRLNDTPFHRDWIP